jgi:hypothetical protein
VTALSRAHHSGSVRLIHRRGVIDFSFSFDVSNDGHCPVLNDVHAAAAVKILLTLPSQGFELHRKEDCHNRLAKHYPQRSVNHLSGLTMERHGSDCAARVPTAYDGPADGSASRTAFKLPSPAALSAEKGLKTNVSLTSALMLGGRAADQTKRPPEGGLSVALTVMLIRLGALRSSADDKPRSRRRRSQ